MTSQPNGSTTPWATCDFSALCVSYGVEDIKNTRRLGVTAHPGDIMIRFSAPENWTDKASKDVTVTDKASKDLIVPDKTSDRVTDKVTDEEKLLLSLLKESPSNTSVELAERAHVSRKTILLRIRSLRQKGLIARVGSSRKGHWKILTGSVEQGHTAAFG